MVVDTGTGEERVEAERGRDRGRDEVVLRFPTLDRLFRELVPDEARQHLRNARKERLLAVRSILDAAIERCDRPNAADSHQRPMRMDIQVE